MVEINIRNELANFLSTKNNILDENEVGELKNITISNAEDDMEKYVLPSNRISKGWWIDTDVLKKLNI